MFEAFKISFRLKNTYRTNSILYSLKQFPILKKLLPDSLYSCHGLKIFAGVISGIVEFVSVFLGKLIYLAAMIFSVLSFMKSPKPDTMLHLFLFLTLVGGVLNTHMFEPTKDKYYALVLMRMDAKAYTLSNYCYFLLKMLVGFLPFTILFGLAAGVPLGLCLLTPVYVIAVKLICGALLLKNYAHKGKAANENLPDPVIWAIVGGLLAAAYLPPIFGIALNGIVFALFTAAATIAAVFAGRYIVIFENYRGVYKDLLTENTVMAVANTGNLQQTAMQKKIDLTDGVTSSGEGYQYFNELFMKRHRRILMKSAKRITLISACVVVLLLVLCAVNKDAKTSLNELTLTFLPYFLFVMYLINRGQVVTKAMFMNCDHSMLAYRFYRQPKVILGLFTERLKSVIKINLLPAVVIAAGLPLILFCSGGTDTPLNYFLLFISIIAMSIFFSVHYMVLYYLLQPYNVNIEMKNSTYAVISGLTYLVCYIAIGKQIPTLIFGTVITIFSILYVMIALILAYRLAPKTFKLRP